MSTPAANLVFTALIRRPRRVADLPAREVPTQTAVLSSGLAEGNEEAFTRFHGLYFDRLYQFLLGVTRGAEQDARDALQETYVRVARHARRFDDEDVFWCWLKAIARSAALDGGRRRNRYLGLLARFTSFLRTNTGAPEQDRGIGLGGLLREHLERLEPEDRALLERKYLQSETIKQLARRLGLSEKAVESRLLRARRELRQRVLRSLNRDE